MAGGEHQMSAGGAGQGKVAAPEKWLNRFVRAVVLIERVGNALGTLAFTWATVVLLGGYASKLSSDEGFPSATAIFFIEAARYVLYICRVLFIPLITLTSFLHRCHQTSTTI
uniref:Predicted protein n=1 Tax=Hordeum vulgare subsp. vulgare TaxID=112509 RepID=F2D7N6_HORVV|nr:predicted protein [Hordeum vulgare subsp. vulgare]